MLLGSGGGGASVAGEHELLAHSVAPVGPTDHKPETVQPVEPELLVSATSFVERLELLQREGTPAAEGLAEADDPLGGDFLLQVAERIPEVGFGVDVGRLGEVDETSQRARLLPLCPAPRIPDFRTVEQVLIS
jgi:hypothetical protein